MGDFLPPPFQPGRAVAPMSEVEISVSCRKIIDADFFSKSDPMVVLYVAEPGREKWKEFGRTEIIWNNLNPDFVEKFIIHYYFQESQKLKFEVYHMKSETCADLSRHHFLGRLECTLGEVISSSRLIRPLSGPKKASGEIIVTSEELRSCKEQVTLQFCAHNLDKKDLFGKSDPFLTFSKQNKDGSFTLTHKTEVKKCTLDPTWKPFTVSVRSLCNGDYDRPIKVDCYDWEFHGGHDYIGSFTTTVKRLTEESRESNKYQCINETKKTKKGKEYSDSGTVDLMLCRIERGHTFLDYISGGGTKIHCTFAVSFTSSNGDPNKPSSLHYTGDRENPHYLNPYETAIKCVGHIIKDYNSEREFCAIGFGARLPPDGIVAHEFALNGNPDNPYCKEIEGVLMAYRNSLNKVQLYGPALYAPCVNHVAKFAEKSRNGSDYYILLILTDGTITDMPETTDAIVKAASLPMSIIIIGIGNANFDAMNVLDGDDVRLTSNGVKAARDIVQFVPMREFMGSEDNSAADQARLAHEVLEEVPDQFLSYMRAHDLEPRVSQ